MRNKLFKESFNAKKLREADKPAPKSIEDCQKWIDYDMKHYGKISERTNEIIKRAGFQIIKDDHGDYEVTAGKYDESCKKEELKEAMSEKESKVAEIISQLKGMDSSHFYTALMIYELLDIERPTEALIEAIEDYVDDLDTIYDDYVRDEVRIIAEEFDGDKEVKDEVKVETEVEEKLGEFKKPEHKDSNKDFEYKD